MFLRLVKYSLIRLTRTKEVMFWQIAFPILLGTLYYVTFGSVIGNPEQFEAIPVAVVLEEEEKISSETEMFKKVVEEQDLMKAKFIKEKEAQKLLEDNEITGIIYGKPSDKENKIVYSLEIKESGLNQSILKHFLDVYAQQTNIITDIATEAKDIEKVRQVAENLQSEVEYIVSGTLTKGNLSSEAQYFYALIAMACMYAGFAGVNISVKIQANLSTLGKRRNITPMHKMKMVLADVAGTLVVSMLSLVLLLFYLLVILKLDIGERWGYMLIVCLAGGLIGIMFGVFVGALGKGDTDMKIGIFVGITMFLCMLGGLMFSGMKALVGNVFPLGNRINPVTVITDALYALNVYENDTRFWQDIIILLVMSVVICVAGYFLIRRKKYASL